MRPGACRRPRITDILVLVGATAVASHLARAFPIHYFHQGPPTGREVADWVGIWGPAWLTPMTLAALIVRLRRPIPPTRRLMRQPGMIASTLVVLLLVAEGLILLVRLGIGAMLPAEEMHGYLEMSGSRRPPIGPDVHFHVLIGAGGPVILGGWLALALAGRLRRERGWIDGFGTIVGACWVAASLFTIHRFLFV